MLIEAQLGSQLQLVTQAQICLSIEIDNFVNSKPTLSLYRQV